MAVTETVAHSSLSVEPLGTTWEPKYPTTDLVGASIALFERGAPLEYGGGPGKRHKRAPYVLQVSPGTIALAYSPGDSGRDGTAQAAISDRGGLCDVLDRKILDLGADAGLYRQLPAVDWNKLDAAKLADEADRFMGTVSWTARSRARLRRRLSEMDYSALEAACAGRAPVMVTLTYPGDWVRVAPTAEASKRHLRSLIKRWARRFGQRPPLIWKLEFQARGAPHYHVLVPLPAGVERADFREWLSQAWAAVVAHPDPEQYARHLVAGTGVDAVVGGTMRDPKRLAQYFLKHGTGKTKEYQHRVPAEWLAAGGAGRFWGYQGLQLAVRQVAVDRQTYVALRRTLRRYWRSRGLTRVCVVDRVDTASGVIRRRTVTRRAGPVGGTGAGTLAGAWVGFNDAPAVAARLSRL